MSGWFASKPSQGLGQPSGLSESSNESRKSNSWLRNKISAPGRLLRKLSFGKQRPKEVRKEAPRLDDRHVEVSKAMMERTKSIRVMRTESIRLDRAGTFKQLEDLSVDEVGYLMESLNLGKFKDIFKANAVDGQTLVLAESEDEISDLGVNLSLKARLMFKKIHDYKKNGVPMGLIQRPVVDADIAKEAKKTSAVPVEQAGHPISPRPRMGTTAAILDIKGVDISNQSASMKDASGAALTGESFYSESSGSVQSAKSRRRLSAPAHLSKGMIKELGQEMFRFSLEESAKTNSDLDTLASVVSVSSPIDDATVSTMTSCAVSHTDPTSTSSRLQNADADAGGNGNTATESSSADRNSSDLIRPSSVRFDDSANSIHTLLDDEIESFMIPAEDKALCKASSSGDSISDNIYVTRENESQSGSSEDVGSPVKMPDKAELQRIESKMSNLLKISMKNERSVSLRRFSTRNVVMNKKPEILHGKTVVIDMGSHMIRAGFAGEDKPTSIFPSVVVQGYEDDDEGEDEDPFFYVGDDAIATTHEDPEARHRPYANGAVSSWDEMEVIWDHCFDEILHVHPSATSVLMTEAHAPADQTRQRTAESMFELFRVDSFYLHTQPVLALYASGLTSGLVIDSGEHSTTVFPICDGFQMSNACTKASIGGASLTNLMLKHMLKHSRAPKCPNPYLKNRYTRAGYPRVSLAETVKETFAYTKTSKTFTEKTASEMYTLPDGTSITLGEELYRCTEKMFDTSIDRNLLSIDEVKPLQELVMDSVNKCAVDMRKTLLEHVVLAGGNTMFDGLQQRLSSDLKAIVAPGMSPSVNIIAPVDRDISVWKGGAILASLSTFEEQWITKEEYDEVGSHIIHEKCPVFL